MLRMDLWEDIRRKDCTLSHSCTMYSFQSAERNVFHFHENQDVLVLPISGCSFPLTAQVNPITQCQGLNDWLLLRQKPGIIVKFLLLRGTQKGKVGIIIIWPKKLQLPYQNVRRFNLNCHQAVSLCLNRDAGQVRTLSNSEASWPPWSIKQMFYCLIPSSDCEVQRD